MKTAVNTHRANHPAIAFANLWHPFLNWSRRTQALDALSGLSDRHLRDIGVARGDIEMAVDRELGKYRSR